MYGHHPVKDWCRATPKSDSHCHTTTYSSHADGCIPTALSHCAYGEEKTHMSKISFSGLGQTCDDEDVVVFSGLSDKLFKHPTCNETQLVLNLRDCPADIPACGRISINMKSKCKKEYNYDMCVIYDLADYEEGCCGSIHTVTLETKSGFRRSEEYYESGVYPGGEREKWSSHCNNVTPTCLVKLSVQKCGTAYKLYGFVLQCHYNDTSSDYQKHHHMDRYMERCHDVCQKDPSCIEYSCQEEFEKKYMEEITTMFAVPATSGMRMSVKCGSGTLLGASSCKDGQDMVVIDGQIYRALMIRGIYERLRSECSSDNAVLMMMNEAETFKKVIYTASPRLGDVLCKWLESGKLTFLNLITSRSGLPVEMPHAPETGQSIYDEITIPEVSSNSHYDTYRGKGKCSSYQDELDQLIGDLEYLKDPTECTTGYGHDSVVEDALLLVAFHSFYGDVNPMMKFLSGEACNLAARVVEEPLESFLKISWTDLENLSTWWNKRIQLLGDGDACDIDPFTSLSGRMGWTATNVKHPSMKGSVTCYSLLSTHSAGLHGGCPEKLETNAKDYVMMLNIPEANLRVHLMVNGYKGTKKEFTQRLIKFVFARIIMDNMEKICWKPECKPHPRPATPKTIHPIAPHVISCDQERILENWVSREETLEPLGQGLDCADSYDFCGTEKDKNQWRAKKTLEIVPYQSPKSYRYGHRLHGCDNVTLTHTIVITTKKEGKVGCWADRRPCDMNKLRKYYLAKKCITECEPCTGETHTVEEQWKLYVYNDACCKFEEVDFELDGINLRCPEKCPDRYEGSILVDGERYFTSGALDDMHEAMRDNHISLKYNGIHYSTNGKTLKDSEFEVGKPTGFRVLGYPPRYRRGRGIRYPPYRRFVQPIRRKVRGFGRSLIFDPYYGQWIWNWI